MKVDIYERVWMWGVAVVLAAFFVSTAVAAYGRQFHPPSHIETIDPRTAITDPRMAPHGASVDADGQVHVRVVGVTFAWLPAEVTVPADTPITFHLTAADVVHGFQIVGTNGQAMVIPGYISQFTTQFQTPGEYLIACNEYCGVGHHMMAGKLIVVPQNMWEPPASSGEPDLDSEEVAG